MQEIILYILTIRFQFSWFFLIFFCVNWFSREKLTRWLFVTALLVRRLVRHWPQHAVAGSSCYLWDFWRYFCDHNVIWKTHVDDRRYILLERIVFEKMRNLKINYYYFVVIECVLSFLIGTFPCGKRIRLHYNWGRLWRLCGCFSFIRSSTLESFTCWSRYELYLSKSSG